MATLSTQQARLQDDLRGLVAGDVRCDDIIAQLYATDASLFEYRPLGVVWPRTTGDVATAAAYCAENGIPIHPRGSGTTSSGGSLGPGLVLDFTRHMRRILHAEGDSVLVQPGAVRERFNDILRRSTGRFFPPCAGFLPTNTLGCIVSTDIAGPRWLKYGFPHDYVEGLEIVTASGEVADLAPIELSRMTSSDSAENGAEGAGPLWWKKAPFKAAFQTVSRYAESIRIEQPARTPNRAGYLLRGVIEGDRFNPLRLFTGAEGSLGIITKIRIRTSLRPKHSGGAILLFDSLEKTANSVTSILESEPTLCELIDRRSINMICGQNARFAPFLPKGTEYALLVELQDDSPSRLGERLNDLVRRVRYGKTLSFGSLLAQSPDEFGIFTELLKRSELALLRIGETFQLVTLFEDLQVPVERLTDFLVILQTLLKKYNVIYSLGGHFGQGQIRVLPIRDLKDPHGFENMTRLAEEMSAEVVRFGGTIGSAHGCGLARPRFVPGRYPKLFPAFAEIKRAFDPAGLMNPQTGVAFPNGERFFTAYKESDPSSERSEIWGRTLRADHHERDFREDETFLSESDSPFSVFGDDFEDGDSSFAVPEGDKPAEEEGPDGAVPLSLDKTRPSQLEVQFKWNRRQIAADVFQCTGCGLCRSRSSGLRMCPAFRHYPDEQASCRAKANVLRGVLDGTLPLETLSEDSLRIIGDLCIGCHCCQTECPTGTDIPKLAFRIQSAYAAAHGLSLSDKILSNLDIFLKIGSFFSCPFNLINRSRFSRWMIEKTLGISQGRKFPKMEKINFLSRLAWKKRPPVRSGRKQERRVVLFVDMFADYYDARLVESARSVLEHNGVEVQIPTRQKSSGHLAFAFGNLERSEKLSRFNVRLLSDYVRQGYQIVTLEPISAVCLSREYLWIRNDPETRLVASNTADLSSYLYSLHKEGRLALDFSPLPFTVGYHAPCRTLALMGDSVKLQTPAEELLRLIPRLTVRRLERGCCGLAGPTGFKRPNHMMSLRLGIPLFLALRESSIAFGATECNICRLQMEQGTDKRVIHPIKLLACAYGLLRPSEISL